MTSDDSQFVPALDGPEGSCEFPSHHTCDRCGASMVELQCKIICINCGHRLDCSDLNIHFD